MEKKQIEKIVKEIIADKSEYDFVTINEKTNLTEDLGMDSLEKVMVFMEFENAFGISIPDDEADNAVTVEDCIALVEKYSD